MTLNLSNGSHACRSESEADLNQAFFLGGDSGKNCGKVFHSAKFGLRRVRFGYSRTQRFDGETESRH